MKRKIAAGLAGVGLLVALGGGAVGGYSAYAENRCRQDLQDVKDNSYAAYFRLTGDTQASLDYQWEQEMRVLNSRWCKSYLA